MATETLTQQNFAFGTFTPIIQTVRDLLTKDQNGVSISVFVSIVNGGAPVLRFEPWGPSTAVIDNLTLSGNYNGFPTGYSMTFHGTGNITGHGNDDAYTGTCSGTVSYSGENNHWQSIFHNFVANITYTD